MDPKHPLQQLVLNHLCFSGLQAGGVTLLEMAALNFGQDFRKSICSLVLRREWGNGLDKDYVLGFYRDYYTDPFPHSLLSTRGIFSLI